MSERGPSMLRPAQRALLRIVGALGALAIADTLYLVAYRFLLERPRELPLFYQGALLSHTGIGITLVALASAFAAWHLRRALRRRSWAMLASGGALLASAIALLATGLFILTEASSQKHRAVFYAHAALGGGAVLLYAGHRALSVARPPAAAAARAGALVFALAGAFLGGHVALGRLVPVPVPPPLPAAPFEPSPTSPFFPSPTTTLSGETMPVDYIVSAPTCVRCHASIVDQWSRSAHRFSSFNNPFYKATIEDMRATVGFTKSRWCAGCHDPALLFTGAMDEPIDATTRAAQAGLQCLACHAIDAIHDVRGNGNYTLGAEAREPYLFADREGGAAQAIHDAIVKARPAVHKALMKKPFMTGGAFCGTCHKVSLPQAVNDYRWLRGQNEYDAWHDSGVAGNAARTFYLPPATKTCQDCHMPYEPAALGDAAAKGSPPMVRSHRFLAVNTALPHVRGDRETIERTERFLREEKLRVDIFARRGNEVHVVVRNLGVGHTFPGGTNDSNEGWLHVRALDAKGEVLFESGAVRPDGEVDPDAHFYGACVVDRHGRRIDRRNAQDIHSVVFASVIGPGTAQLVRYEVPPGTARVEAALRWRKFRKVYTDFVYGEVGPPNGPLPISTIAEDAVALAPGAETPPLEGREKPPLWVRWNDYGIGLFLQGDLRGAGRAFEKVEELEPRRADGPRNLARVALREGHIPEAYAHLARCEEIAPSDPQTAFFWGEALLEDGKLEDAEKALLCCLERFPEDRAAWKMLGRARFLRGAHEAALEALGRALAIDPEDRQAHYHRMLALRALGREAEARAAEQDYERYRIDEDAQSIQTAFRLGNPPVQRESQPIHVHGARHAD